MDFDLTRKITNRTLHKKVVSLQSELNYEIEPMGSAINTLLMGDFDEGFTVTDYYKVSLGPGAVARLFLDNSTGLAKLFGSYAGIVPYQGKAMKAVRYAPNLEVAKSLDRFQSPPQNASELASLAIGDNLTYDAVGGVMCFSGAGITGASLNAIKVAQGSWNVYIEKNSNSHVFVKLTNSKLDSVGIQVGNAIVSAGKNSFDSEDEAFSYEVDITSSLGKQAYEDLISGNVAGIQALLNKKDPTVKLVTHQSAKRSGSAKSYYFGIPLILYTNWSTGKTNTDELTSFELDQKKMKAQYSI